MAGIGFLAAVWVAQRKREYAQLNEEQITNIFVFTMIFAILGARVYYIIENPAVFQGADFMKYIAIWEGGLVYFGGFIMASAFMILYAWIRKVNILKIMDIFAVSLPLGHAFGRIGCFFQGCCYGHQTDLPWGICYPTTMENHQYIYRDIMVNFKNIPIHPVQIYESLAILCVFFIGLKFFGKLKPGRSASLYFIIYGIFRFFVEGFRGEYAPEQMKHIGPFELMPGQYDSLVVVIPLGILIWIVTGFVARYREQKATQTEATNSESESL